MPAALAGVLPAVLLGAAPARAASGCDLHYCWTPLSSPSSWVDAVILGGHPLSCRTSPAIARFSGGSEIMARLQDSVGWYNDRNVDDDPYWELDGIYPDISKGMAGGASLTTHSSGLVQRLAPPGARLRDGHRFSLFLRFRCSARIRA
jgi:hypothetical protein